MKLAVESGDIFAAAVKLLANTWHSVHNVGMELVIIVGPPAVGKMSVGMELAKKTGFKLFHNHMSIEFVQPIFNYGTATGRKLVSEFRWRIFEEVARSDLKGFIYTYVWAFNLPEEKESMDRLRALFEKNGARVSFVELTADLPLRLQRNRSALRLEHKASKRDLEWSHQNVLDLEREHQMNIGSAFYYPEIHTCIDNTDLSPEAVADQIIERFALKGA